MPICANCNEFKDAIDFYDHDIFGVCSCGRGYCKECLNIFADKYGYLDYKSETNELQIFCCDKCITPQHIEDIKNNKNLVDLTKLLSQLNINEPNRRRL